LIRPIGSRSTAGADWHFLPAQCNQIQCFPSGLPGGKSLGIEDGNGDGRGAIGVTAGPGATIGRGDEDEAARAGSFDLACRRFGDAFFAARFFAGRRFVATLRLRATAARFFRATFFLALRLFAMVLLQSL
jgi:hypothetical protein